MTSWAEAAPSLLVALAVLAVPGGLTVAVLRLRGILAIAIAPAISVSIVAVSAVVAPWLGLSWGWQAVALGTLVTLGLAEAARRLVPSLRPSATARFERAGSLGRMSRAFTGDAGAPIGSDRESRLTVGALIGVVVAAAAISTRVMLAAGNPEQITQNYDTVFHLNALRHVLDSGNGSSFFLATFMRPTDAPSFYPAAWHDLATLVIQLTGVSIPVAANVTWFASSAVVWPLACVLFTRVLVGPQTAVVAAAGVLSAAFSASPFLLLQYGSAYPNALANCLVPVGIALVLLIVRRTGSPPATRALAILLLALIVPGIALAQPNGLFSIAFLTTPVLAAVVWRWLRRGFTRGLEAGLLRVAVAMLAVVLGGTVLFTNPVFTGLFRYANPQVISFAEALGRGIVNAPLPTHTPALVLSALVLAGLTVAVLRLRHRWLAVSWLLALLSYAFAVGANDRFLNALIAPWWGNPERIAALLPMLGVPLAAIGAVWVTGLALRRWRAWVGAAASVLVIAIIVLSPTLRDMDAALARVFTVPDRPDPLAQLDTDELALIKRLDEFVPPDAVMANNPWNGSALAMALADRAVLFPYSSMRALDNDQWWLSMGLDNIGHSPIICKAARHKNVEFLLDFGNDFIAPAKFASRTYPGIDAAASSDAFELVTAVGHAKLYRLVACAN